MTKKGLQNLMLIAALAAVYFFAAQAGLRLAYLHSSASAVWPPSGIALAAIIFFGIRLWPGVFAGAFLVNFLLNLRQPDISGVAGFFSAVMIASGNTLEAVFCAYLIERFAGGRAAFDRSSSILKFILIAVLFGTVVSPTIGMTSLTLFRLADWHDYFPIWLTWWLGDAVSILLITPFLLIWSRFPKFSTAQPRRILEAFIAVCALIFTTQFSFASWLPETMKNYPVSFLSLPVLMWTAYRFELYGATASILILSATAIWGTVNGIGVFAAVPDRNVALLLLQAYTATMSISTIVLAAMVRERRQTEELRRQQAEKALESTEEKFRLLVEGAKDHAIFMLDPDGYIVSWNAGAERINGYRSDEILGRHFSCFYPDEEVRAGKPAQELVTALEKGWMEDEGWRVRKDGTRFWANVIITTLRDAAGNVRGFGKVARDITERRLAEQKIIEKEQELRDYLNHLSTMSAKVALDGTILMVNEIALAASGLSREEISRTNFIDGAWFSYDPEVHDRLKKTFVRATQGESVNYNEKIFVFGRVMDISFSLVPVIDSYGKVQYLLAEGRDITTLKLAEQALQKAHDELELRVAERTAELRSLNESLTKEITRRKRVEAVLAQQAQELVRSNAELEQFAYIASHDLQEPLRMVASYTQLLESRYKNALDRDANQFIAYAVDGVTRMKELISDLLEYSRLNAPERNFVAVDCNEIFEKAASNLQVAINEKKARVTSDRLPVVKGDYTQLLQLFQNLIGNGIKFNQSAVPSVRVTSEVKGGEAVFCVRDNGIGIDPKYVQKIFVIFQRLNNREQYGGTGIGLTVCKKIVERHGGRIWVESQPEQGAAFYFSLPKED